MNQPGFMWSLVASILLSSATEAGALEISRVKEERCSIEANKATDIKNSSKSRLPTDLRILDRFLTPQSPEDEESEHSYGHEIVLAGAGGKIIGTLTVWIGPPEGRTANIDSAKFNKFTGDLDFTCNHPDLGKVAFKGKLDRSKGRLVGELQLTPKSGFGGGSISLVPVSKEGLPSPEVFWLGYAKNRFLSECMNKP